MSDSNREEFPSSEAQPFLYRPPTGLAPRGLAEGGSSAFGGQQSTSGASPSDQDMKTYQNGVLEGETRARTEYERSIAEVRSEVSGALKSFSKDRADYFSNVEAEVVRLSLSIARKILHRESQIDPLALTGVVHVALQKLSGDTRVRFRAHSDEVRFWNDYFRNSKDISLHVEVIGDPTLAQGECTLETDFGTTQISLDTQLKEIEQGFLDLLEQRPKDQE